MGVERAMTAALPVAIIGAGHVGAATAYALMLRGLFPEMVLIDTVADLAVAEAEDISDASALARPARIFAGAYADAASARIAILTAGAAAFRRARAIVFYSDASTVAGNTAHDTHTCIRPVQYL